ncbi:UNVERIFIED_CONTAM: tetratricopeptide repeat protein, partial [Salmonella enterica subsp. enterica serovar Weltevreden]
SKYEEAIVPLKKAVKLKPDYIEAWNKLALAKLKTKDYKGAEKDLKSALKIAPDNFESRKNLGIVYYENQKFKEAKA